MFCAMSASWTPPRVPWGGTAPSRSPSAQLASRDSRTTKEKPPSAPWPRDGTSSYALSTMGTTSIEDLAVAVPGGRLWFQLYVMRDRAPAADLVARVAAAGYEALMLTIDTP